MGSNYDEARLGPPDAVTLIRQGKRNQLTKNESLVVEAQKPHSLWRR